MKELNFETVNAEIEALDLDQLEKNMGVSLNAQEAIAMPNICNIWSKIGGIVKLIAKFPFLPPKWRTNLNLLIKTMDGICG